MIRALDEAWERFQGTGVQLALAKQIVDMARQGERDRQRLMLIEGALFRLKL